MDKIIEKKKGIARALTLKALPYWLGSAVAVLLIVLLARSSNGAMRIDPDTLTMLADRAQQILWREPLSMFRMVSSSCLKYSCEKWQGSADNKPVSMPASASPPRPM